MEPFALVILRSEPGHVWRVLEHLPVDVGWVRIWRETGRPAPNIRHGEERWVPISELISAE